VLNKFFSRTSFSFIVDEHFKLLVPILSAEIQNHYNELESIIIISPNIIILSALAGTSNHLYNITTFVLIIMSINFQQIREKIIEMGEKSPQQRQLFETRREKALETMSQYGADNLHLLINRIDAALQYNPYLRCAVPVEGDLNTAIPCPQAPATASLLAADGSQIYPDRHAAVEYCVVNVGSICMTHGAAKTPETVVRSQLLYDDQMWTENGRITERLVALMRDLEERKLLAELAKDLPHPIITLTDGPLELWMGQEGSESREFERRFDEYLVALQELSDIGATTAGYIDKPASNIFVRMLEIAFIPELELKNTKNLRNFMGVKDTDIFKEFLGPYERSAVFKIQSRSAEKYEDDLALYFFYLNVGETQEGRPYLVRLEIPAWVANNPAKVDELHAILVEQCKIMGSKPLPYLIHRSHEVAVVTMDEKRQIENMIAVELRRKNQEVGTQSFKQAHKDA
jgi:hypothetical protein